VPPHGCVAWRRRRASAVGVPCECSAASRSTHQIMASLNTLASAVSAMATSMLKVQVGRWRH
jgi:hypothetical protein